MKKDTFKQSVVNPYLRSFIAVALVILLAACRQGGAPAVVDKTYEGDGDNLERVTQEMVAPPLLPKHEQVAVGGPKIVEVTLTIAEKKIEIAPGDSVWAMTFNGSVPGPMIGIFKMYIIAHTIIL